MQQAGVVVATVKGADAGQECDANHENDATVTK